MKTETTTASRTVGTGRGGRMSRQRKRDAVLRLLRGEDLETVSRSLGVTAATLSGWRDAFLDGGEASFASKRVDGEERESDRLKARLGEMLLKTERLEQKIALLEGGAGPLGRRRPSRLAARPRRPPPSPMASPGSAGSGAWPGPAFIGIAFPDGSIGIFVWEVIRYP